MNNSLTTNIIMFFSKRDIINFYKANVRLLAQMFILSLIASIDCMGQNLNDDLKMKKGEFCIALNLSQGNWTQYWEANTLIQNQNIGTFSRRVINPMIGIGITDRLNLFADLPYIATEASSGQMRGVSGIQDFTLGLKYNLLQSNFEKFKIALFVSGIYSIPVSNYLSDYQPFSLGLGAQTFTIQPILFFATLDEKFLIRANFNYSQVGYTKAERTFYLSNNEAYYTDLMDVPSRMGYDLSIGSRLMQKSLHLEVFLANQTSLTGDDILRWQMPQPTNKMDMTNVGARFRYFPVRSTSVMFNLMQTIKGRNVGKSTTFLVGFTHVFNL